MGKIRLLEELTINQIAAGEVIERPASVVKELVENALDAGAARIDIEIRAGGRHLIRVTDNGTGMDRDDALMSLERHATSKISTVDDLTILETMGFRGEALASIAAISHFKLITAMRGSTAGTCVEAAGGLIKRVQDIGAAPGTTVSVSELFFNVPPRLKYLKAIPTEASYIADITGRLSLSRPDVAFKLVHGEYEVLFAPGTGKLEDAVEAVLGGSLAKDLIPIQIEKGPLVVRGLIGKPENARSNRQSQYFFVNGRPVRSHLMGTALEKAYHTLLPIARFPLAVIFLEIPGTEVDVNVHPAKAEVRFRAEDEVFRAVFHATNQALRDCSLIPAWQETRLPEAEPSVTVSVPVSTVTQMYQLPMPSPVVSEVAAAELVPSAGNREFLSQSQPQSQSRIPICLGGVLDDTYILATDGDGLMLIDQHAAHERVRFEELMDGDSEAPQRQTLLVAENLELNYRQFRAVADRIMVFEGLGYSIEPFGGKTIIIRAVPVLPGVRDHRKLLLDMIEQFVAMEAFQNPRELREAFITTMSCRTAVKAGDHLEPSERQALVDRLWRTQNPYTCPHGRPTMIRLSRDEMDRRFRRK